MARIDVLLYSGLRLHRADQPWGDALDFVPCNDVAPGVYRAVRLDTVDGVVSEMDGVTIADKLLA